jgi:hypothetical protein
MAIFMEREEYEFLLRAVKFCDKVDNYMNLLDLDPVEVHEFKTDNELFNYVFANQENYGSLAESFTRYKINNLQLKFSELMCACKYSKNYTAQIGDDLGLNVAVPSLDPNMYTPQIKIEYTDEGRPLLKWSKGAFEGVEIWKNSGSASGYQKMARCYGNNYQDNRDLPAKCEVWKYSLIFLFRDEMVGNWSDEVSVIVQGV